MRVFYVIKENKKLWAIHKFEQKKSKKHQCYNKREITLCQD